MRKTINTFLYVGKIIAIVAIVITSIILTVNVIVDTIDLFILFFASITSLILNHYSSIYFLKARNHEEGIKPGVLAIVSGALTIYAPFSAVAGILMLVSKDDVFNDVIDMSKDSEIEKE